MLRAGKTRTLLNAVIDALRDALLKLTLCAGLVVGYCNDDSMSHLFIYRRQCKLGESAGIDDWGLYGSIGICERRAKKTAASLSPDSPQISCWPRRGDVLWCFKKKEEKRWKTSRPVRWGSPTARRRRHTPSLHTRTHTSRNTQLMWGIYGPQLIYIIYFNILI